MKVKSVKTLFGTLSSIFMMGRCILIIATILILFSTDALAKQYLYISDQNGLLYQIDIELKSTNYISNLGAYLTDLSSLDDYQLIGISYNTLYSISSLGQAVFKTLLGVSTANSLGKPKNYSKLYVGCTDGNLYLLDPFSYEMVFIGNLGGGWGYSGDIAFHPVTGEMYASVYSSYATNYLAKVNKITGMGTIVGPINYQSVFGLEFDSDGNLYGATADGWILKIDPATGNGTPLFYTGVTAQGATFSEIQVLPQAAHPPGYFQAWTYQTTGQEPIESIGVSSRGDYVAVGTSEKVNLLDANGKLLWQYQTSHPVIDISTTADASKIVAGTSSGYFGGGTVYFSI